MYQTLKEFIDYLIKESNNNLDLPKVKVNNHEGEIIISKKINISKINHILNNQTILII